MKQKPKVLLAMSGGVDSSVAALLLKKQGYEIIAAFIKSWSDTKDDLGQCTWMADRKMALTIATRLNIPLITLDFEKEYRDLVVDEMYRAYRAGITPNPDVDCNNLVKFPLLWKAAKKLGCDFIATGHYARIKKLGRGYSLLRAKDETKDQSYFLYRLTQKDLEHTLFPIGELAKKAVRKIAEKNKLPNFNRKSTTGICFIGKVDLKKFLQKKIKPKKGKILGPEGNVIGHHDGVYYYTIGQRIGPRFGLDVHRGTGAQQRWYVASKDVKENIIVAAPENHKLNFRKDIVIKQPHWISEKPKNNWLVRARIRQVGELLPAKLTYKAGKYRVTLKKAINGISTGQAIVLYHGPNCLGGGVISF